METPMTDTIFAEGDHRDLLDIIDSLRSQGVSRYVDLPEIIVCGDQSAGKSSVLEAISGMSFPTKDGLCTRFATELILRRGRDENIRVSISPGENRFGEDRERLKIWQPKASIAKEGLGAVTDEAKRAMADPPGTGRFYEDILRIELTGPEQPHLTMVDLPGLFKRGDKDQSEDDVGIVRGMVEKYMARPRSIILTVVSAKYDYVLQEVTAMAKRADPEGLRTIGLITKPDTLEVGSESENYFFRLAQNLESELCLGWHVLKNRKFEERDISSVQRNTIEREFFSQGLWDSIDSSHCGAAALRVRLSTVLRDQILAQLPSLVEDVDDGIRDCTGKLDRLGPVRRTPQQQQSYLLRVSEGYTSLVTQAVEGTYTDGFFGRRKTIDRFTTRLRAVVQNRLREFAEEMRLSGQSEYIVDSETEDEGSGGVRDRPHISRSEYVEKVTQRLKFSKGRELPGLFNPLVVGDLFVDQCKPWEEITRRLVEDIVDATYLTTQLIVEHIAAHDVAEGVLELICSKIERLKAELDARVNALLESTANHPITYNDELTKNVQRVQQARHKRAIKKLVWKTFGFHRFHPPDSKISLNPIKFVDLVGQEFEPDMERFGSALAVDYMEAYYKVAAKRFVDDVSALAIEECLISKLPTLLRSSAIPELSDKEISRVAGETEESLRERERLEVKRTVLETGLMSLKSLYKRSKVVNPQKQDQRASVDSNQMPAMTPSRSEKASTADDSAEAASRASIPHKLSYFRDGVPISPQIDKKPPQAESHSSMDDSWDPTPKGTRRESSMYSFVGAPHLSREWSY